MGGLIAREVGGDPRHSKRDLLAGALIGGLGANALENQYKSYKEDKDEKWGRDRRDEYSSGRRRRRRSQ